MESAEEKDSYKSIEIETIHQAFLAFPACSDEGREAAISISAAPN